MQILLSPANIDQSTRRKFLIRIEFECPDLKAKAEDIENSFIFIAKTFSMVMEIHLRICNKEDSYFCFERASLPTGAIMGMAKRRFSNGYLSNH